MSEASAPLLGVEESLTGRYWQESGADGRLALALSQRLGLPEVLGRVLASRGVGLDDADAFLNPSLKRAMPDPSAIADMDRAATQIADAIAGRKQIAIFGDYDVDGATSAAVLTRFLRTVGTEPRIYVPDRMREGYGPNAPALLALKAEGVDLVITVDCGILAFEPLAEAKAAGLDMIVVDHHLAEPRLPQARAVINPNRLDDDSGLGMLAAVGVAFMLVVAVNRALRERKWYCGTRPEPDLLQWLDLVALGTVCDVVPLKGLNRVLVTQGLKVAASRRNIGLAALADAAGVDGRPTAYHLGFLLGPRVNAGGRIGRADLGARLLTTESGDEAATIAHELNVLNQERQAIEEMVLQQAIDIVEENALQSGPLVFVAGSGWHQGVLGIVASRLKERYDRPAFVLGRDGVQAKGSGRSVPGIDLGAAVTAARQAGLLLAGGGHAMAAGVTVASDRLEELGGFLTERLAKQAQEMPRRARLRFDGLLAPRAATRELFSTLERIGPYGAGHPEPRFALPGCSVVDSSVVGKGHVRAVLAGEDGGRLKAIAFRSADGPLGQALLNARGRRLHVAGHLRADDWRGREGVQLIVEDAAMA